MKGTITSLVLLALELTLCLVSPRWRSMEVNDSEICFKNIFTQFNTNPMKHQYLHIGPIFSSRITKTDNNPEHFASDHAKVPTALLIIGIVLIIISALTLSLIQFCSSKSMLNRCHKWLHLINVVILIISLILLNVGFYSLQHILNHPLNGSAALGFFIGILFVVMLITYSSIKFWANIENKSNKKKAIEEVAL